jgi:hypothetical protein
MEKQPLLTAEQEERMADYWNNDMDLEDEGEGAAEDGQAVM